MKNNKKLFALKPFVFSKIWKFERRVLPTMQGTSSFLISGEIDFLGILFNLVETGIPKKHSSWYDFSRYF